MNPKEGGRGLGLRLASSGASSLSDSSQERTPRDSRETDISYSHEDDSTKEEKDASADLPIHGGTLRGILQGDLKVWADRAEDMDFKAGHWPTGEFLLRVYAVMGREALSFEIRLSRCRRLWQMPASVVAQGWTFGVGGGGIFGHLHMKGQTRHRSAGLHLTTKQTNMCSRGCGGRHVRPSCIRYRYEQSQVVPERQSWIY